MKERLKKFIELFQAPDFVIPYIPSFVSEEEVNLVVLFNGDELTVDEAAIRLGIPVKDASKALEDAYLNYVFNKKEEEDTIKYVMANFYEKLDFNCKFDADYFAIPKSVRDELDTWCYNEYKKRMAPFLEKIRVGEPVDKEKEAFLLLEDVDDFIENSKEYRVVPCNCRNLKQGCDKPIDTCMRFDRSIDERTFGRIISRAEAREIIYNANKKGLMQLVNRDWREKGPKYMCNCCTTCCYPFRLVEDLGIKGLWPQITYVAKYDQETCNYCGLCAKRCMFEAFYHTGSEIEYKGKLRKEVAYEEKKCFGCGLCAVTCPTKSITIEKLNS